MKFSSPLVLVIVFLDLEFQMFLVSVLQVTGLKARVATGVAAKNHILQLPTKKKLILAACFWLGPKSLPSELVYQLLTLDTKTTCTWPPD